MLSAVAVIEAGAGLTTRYLTGRGWMAEIPVFQSTHIEQYFEHRDPVLGWTSSFVTVNAACVSAYGDSFTAGAGDSSYPAEVARMLGCPVANYGVGGYGSDQALMLARSLRDMDRAPVSVIAHVSENILRNLNQYRNLLYPGQELFFKPRFILDGAALRLLDNPIARREDFTRLAQSPETVLVHDEFGSRPRREFPYTIALLRWLSADFHLRAETAGVPRHQAFYEPGHRAGGLQLTAAILTSFARERTSEGRQPLVVLVSTGDDFLYAKRTQQWPDQGLADMLQAAGVATVHTGPVMLAELGDEDPCHLFAVCNSHFNARGYRMLGTVIATAIQRVAAPPHTVR